MNQLYTYFSASTNRWRVLKEALGPGGLVVQKLSTTRWSARVDAAAALAKGYDSILEALCEIANDADQTADARVEATGLRDLMDELETAILTEVWYEILMQSNKISVTLQTAGIALNTAVGLLKSLIDFVQQKRDKFDHVECCGVELVGHEEYKAENKRVRRRNVRWDIGTGEESLLQPRERFKVEVFVPIIDNLFRALRHRLNAYEAVYANFRFLSNLRTSSSNDISCS